MEDRKAIGQNIDSYCGKCRQSTDHTIMIMDADTVSRVRCKSCGGTHKFRSPADEAAVRKPRTKNIVDEAAAAAIVWEAGLAEARGKEQDYSMTTKFCIGDIVNHQTFGKGVVLKLYVNKCSMLFKDGEKLMASSNL